MTPSTDSSLESSTSTQVNTTPFPAQYMSFIGEESETKEEETTYSDSYEFSSPFQSLYELENEEGMVDTETEEVMEFLNELYDEEFDEALYELINEADDLYQERFESEYEGNLVAQRIEAERVLEVHFAPLVSETEAFLEGMVEEVDKFDFDIMSEAEIEAFIDQYETQTVLAPNPEYFWGKAKKWLKKKAKKAFKKATKLARRGFKAAKRYGKKWAKKLAMRALRKLKRLIKPLLKRVLKFAINKIPAKYRPLAKMLAKRFGLLKEVEEEGALAAENDAINDISEIQREFDRQIAYLLFAESEEEQEAVIADYINESEQIVTQEPLGDLDRARAQFIQQLAQLEEDKELESLVENFAPALLAAARLGIRLIGRPKVIKFLAKFLSKLLWKLIKKFLGTRKGGKFRPYVSPLSRAIVDAGLRLINLETTPEAEAEAAEAAIMATVEDTIRQVAALPDYILDNEELLEGYTLKAFEDALSHNIPQVLSDKVYEQRPELRETNSINGTWVLQPLGSGGHYKYKKYTRIFDIKISPYTARVVKICCGTPLMGYLRDRLGLSPGKTVRAKVHLYEAIPGTLLSQICKQEKHVPGLGMRSAYSHLHPLTPVAAGMLLRESGLGREMPPKYLGHEPMAAVGQRFYYLEISQAHPQMMMISNSMSVTRHSSQVYLTLNFPADQIRALIYLSEAQAQAMAMKLRQGAPIGMMMASLKSILDYKLKTALSGSMCGHIKIIHGAVTPEQSRGSVLKLLPQIVLENLTQKLREWLGLYLSKHLQKHRQDFIVATENLADGVTLVVTLDNPPGFALLRKALRGEAVSLYSMGFSEGMPNIQLQIVSGYYRD